MKILENNSNKDQFVETRMDNPTYNKMKRICDKYGYQLNRAYYTTCGEAIVDIRPAGGRYLPEVSAPSIVYPEWQICATGYGYLPAEEFADLTSAYLRAYAMVEALSDLDLSTLDHYPVSK